MKKISHEVFLEFLKGYYETEPRFLRLGQAFCNKFFTENESDSQLFYESDNSKAVDYISDKYIDWTLPTNRS